jgi:hypothetical protein
MKRKQLESHSGQRLERHARKNRNALSFVASGLPFENLPLNYPQSMRCRASTSWNLQ